MNFTTLFRRLILSFAALTVSAAALAQSAYEEIMADPDKAGGIYYMYS